MLMHYLLGPCLKILDKRTLCPLLQPLLVDLVDLLDLVDLAVVLLVGVMVAVMVVVAVEVVVEVAEHLLQDLLDLLLVVLLLDHLFLLHLLYYLQAVGLLALFACRYFAYLLLQCGALLLEK